MVFAGADVVCLAALVLPHPQTPLSPSSSKPSKEAETRARRETAGKAAGQSKSAGNLELQQGKEDVKSVATSVEDVVFRPGPYHAVNDDKSRTKKLLPGYLVRRH